MSILEEAESLINGERQEQYGNANESFARIANLWSVYLGANLTALDVTNLMILLKVSRAKGLYHRDSYVDIAGYSGLAEKIGGEEELDLEIIGEFNEYGDRIDLDQDWKVSLWTIEDVDREEWELTLSEARTEYEE